MREPGAAVAGRRSRCLILPRLPSPSSVFRRLPMLKSLEIFGFKSFADRIRFDFAPGITGVVGPNGSGKSNVVDSIKWILGDQSAKSLRGKEMTDVIFNGASSRKPSAFAEATLTFDNSSGFLPIDARGSPNRPAHYPSGEAEYLVNRTPARLKDIRDLFMGTGAGSASYCIIEQGRVDQILQANVSARRLIFEEAAGISRFKTRKDRRRTQARTRRPERLAADRHRRRGRGAAQHDPQPGGESGQVPPGLRATSRTVAGPGRRSIPRDIRLGIAAVDETFAAQSKSGSTG